MSNLEDAIEDVARNEDAVHVLHRGGADVAVILSYVAYRELITEVETFRVLAEVREAKQS